MVPVPILRRMAALIALLVSAPAEADRIRAALDPAPAPGYVMHAVRVGVTRDARRATFIADASLGDHVDIAFAFWVLRGFGRVVLIDAGFVERRFIRIWRVEQYRDPVAGLAALGIEPEQVTDVVVTHHHWDHIGGLVRFPHATVWLDARTLAGARASKNTELIATLRVAEREGRLHRTGSLQRILPHTVMVHAGLHTRGFSYLVVENHDGTWVFASDIVPLRKNLIRDRPTGLTTNARKTLAVMATIRALVNGDLGRVVPGHEPSGFDSNGVRHLSP